MVVEVNDVFVMQYSVQFDFSSRSVNQTVASLINNSSNAARSKYITAGKQVTFSLWWGLETRVCGMILAAYILPVLRSVNS